MLFSQKKLPLEAAKDLRRFPVNRVAPFSLMAVPVYIFLKRNKKFVSVKEPLDFFDPEELERFEPFENFFVPSYIDLAEPFVSAAQRVRAILSWKPKKAKPTKDNPYVEPDLPPTGYELSDAIVRVVGGLWSKDFDIEPYFVALFANELCNPLPTGMLQDAREKSVQEYEAAIFRSSWAVFLALHLGFTELKSLSHLRFKTFETSIFGRAHEKPRNEFDELDQLACVTLNDAFQKVFHWDTVKSNSSNTRLKQKLDHRFERVKTSLIDPNRPEITIYGEGGLGDV